MTAKRLIDLCTARPNPLVVPLMGFPGTQLTHSSIWQNEFNSDLQFRSIQALVERFEPDAIFYIMDLAVEAGAIGLPVLFPVDGSPTVRSHLVKDIQDLEQLKIVDILHDARVKTYLDVMRRMSTNLNIPKGAYVIGPFTLAGLMLGATELAMATIDNPALVHAAAEFATQTIIRYAKALVEAGADMIVILEPTATFISSKAFKKFSGQYVEKIIRSIEAMPVLHICGDTKHLISAMCETGAQGLSLDAPVDFNDTIQKIPSDMVLIGNIDPVRVMVYETPKGVEKAVHHLLNKMRGHQNFILSTGCDLPPETPLDNIAAFIKAGRNLN